MNEAFWQGFSAELQKEAGLEPHVAVRLKGYLKNLGKIGIFAGAAVGGYKLLRHYVGMFDRMVAMPIGFPRDRRRS